MGSKDPTRTARRPLFMQRRSTDEYMPPAYSNRDERVLKHIASDLTYVSEHTGRPARLLATDRLGTAIGLRAINKEWGFEYFEVPEPAALESATAEELFSGPEVVVDVQTHLIAPGTNPVHNSFLDKVYGLLMPDWWKELAPIVSRDTAEYIESVFLRTENAVAILTTGPGLSGEPRPRGLANDEMAAVRELVNGFAGTGRLLNHAVVHPDQRQEIEAMEYWRDEFHPVGWKVYTMGHNTTFGMNETVGSNILEADWVGGYQLDDERFGLPFLERARDLGVPLVCAHKGLAGFVDNGSPRDIGPAAKAFPGLQFVVYHSGFELPAGIGNPDYVPEGDETGEEGPYTDELAHRGVNRLLRSLEEAGLGRDSNVYAELGTTWFTLIRRPREAAHVLGKLIAALGEDHVIWGTDSIWYGAAQPLIDAFRVFQIPDDMCEQYGYAKLTPQTKAKILGENAARIYNIDLARARSVAESDDLAWARSLVKDVQQNGFAGLHR